MDENSRYTDPALDRRPGLIIIPALVGAIVIGVFVFDATTQGIGIVRMLIECIGGGCPR
jgi:hypothetical protein